MTQLIEIGFSGFWQFMGLLIVMHYFVNLIRSMWIRFMRMLMVRKHGWPPAHLDADGDWEPESKSDDDASMQLGNKTTALSK